MEIGVPGVSLFIEGMRVIGLGHVAKRFQKKYSMKLAALNKTSPDSGTSIVVVGAGDSSNIDKGDMVASEEDDYAPPSPPPSRLSRSSLRGGRGGGGKRIGKSGGVCTGRRKKRQKKSTSGNNAEEASQGSKSLNRTNEQQVRFNSSYYLRAHIICDCIN